MVWGRYLYAHRPGASGLARSSRPVSAPWDPLQGEPRRIAQPIGRVPFDHCGDQRHRMRPPRSPQAPTRRRLQPPSQRGQPDDPRERRRRSAPPGSRLPIWPPLPYSAPATTLGSARGTKHAAQAETPHEAARSAQPKPRTTAPGASASNTPPVPATKRSSHTWTRTPAPTAPHRQTQERHSYARPSTR